MKKQIIRVTLFTRGKQVLVFEGEAKDNLQSNKVCQLSDHDLAALLFGCEFAINSPNDPYALGIRCHIELLEV